MSKRLTEHQVRATKSQASRYVIAEDNLLLEVFPSGRKSWYAKYRQHKKQRKEKLGEYPQMSVKDAREAVRNIQQRLAKSPTAVYQTSKTLKAFIDDTFAKWAKDARSDSKGTLGRLKMVMREDPELANTLLREVTLQQLQTYQLKKGRTVKPTTNNRIIGDLKRVFSLAFEWNYIRDNPAKSVRLLRVDNKSTKLYLDDSEVKRLSDAISGWEANCTLNLWPAKDVRSYPEWFPLLVRILINTGCRKGEALQLRWADVDTENRCITFHGTTTKSGLTRAVQINDKLYEDLISYGVSLRVVDFKVDEDNLDDDGTPIPVAILEEDDVKIFPVQNFRKPWKRLQDMADLHHVTPHHLRHHCASIMVKKGADLNIVREILGHSSIEMTSRYLSVRTEDKMQALNLL